VARGLGKTKLVVVGVRRDGESVFTAAGRPEAGYRPDPTAVATLDSLSAATGGRPYGEGGLGAASARLRALLDRGPVAAVVGRTRQETPLAPYVLAAALAPLLLLLRRRST
jgi:hypothetical protein